MTEPAKRKAFSSSRGKHFGTLMQVFDDVWWSWGTTRMFPGMLLSRNMTILREKDELVIVHPVMMPDAEQKKIEALGKIAHIVKLGDFHGMDDALYVKRYGAQRWAPRGSSQQQDLPVDHELYDGGPTPFEGGALHAFDVARFPETVLHLPRHGGLLLTCDSVQNWEAKPPGCSSLALVMCKMMGFGGRACIGPAWRKQCEPKGGDNFGAKFRELLGLEFRHLLSAHGAPVLETAKDDLRAAVDKAYPA